MENEPQPEPTPEPKKKESLWDIVRFALIALLIVVPIRAFIAQPFVVSGSSMVPTFENGEYLIVDETYQFRQPKRGDVIIFKPPQYRNQSGVFFIKRIIGLPGEAVSIEGTTVTVYSDEHPEGFILDEPYVEHEMNGNLHVELDASEYFVMGDNRSHSSDSRSWGPLPKDLIVGRALIRLLPVGNISVLPGDYK